MRKTKSFLFTAGIALALALFASGAFAQDALQPPAEAEPPLPVPENAVPKKFAVYAYGASEAGINKTFASKLLSAITHSGKYAEIANFEAFYKELAKNGEESADQIAQAAKQYGADAVCVVSMTEAFGAYSISARIIKTSDSQTIRTASADRSMNSLDDLARVSNELAIQLFGTRTHAPPPAAAPAEPSPPIPAAALQKECASKFNINEITYNIQSGFPKQLKDCSASLAKEIALSKSPFAKKAAPEPKSFMASCAIDGIKQKLPAGADEYIKPVEAFLQNIMNAASAGGSLDVAKLSSAIGSMNVMELVNELKAKAANDLCIADEPYEPPAEFASEDEENGSEEEDRKILSFGIRVGFNFSHLYAEYNDGYRSSSGTYNSIPGFQLGLLLDIAPSDWFHIQPSLAYIQKGADAANIVSHYVELLPLSLSLKFAAFRLGAGPYFGLCVDASGYIDCDAIDIGINAGAGFDIGMFYIGAFYEHGFADVSGSRGFHFYNRTLGFNLGVNL